MESLIRRTELYPGVTELTLDRASALNALNTTLLEELLAQLGVLRRQSADHLAKVIVLKGAGEKAFVAGADIAVLRDSSGADASPVKAQEFITLGHRVMAEIESHPLPVIACVDGFCLGGGLELALSCDLIYCSDRSKFALPEISLGIIPGFGGTQRLHRRVGIGMARRMVLTGEMISAQEAQSAGLVEKVVESSQLAETVLKVATQLSERSPSALEAAKRVLAAADSPDKAQGLQTEEQHFLKLLANADAKEGLTAFLEKRKPVFHGPS